MVCSWLLILLYKYIFDSTSAAVRVFFGLKRRFGCLGLRFGKAPPTLEHWNS